MKTFVFNPSIAFWNYRGDYRGASKLIRKISITLESNTS